MDIASLKADWVGKGFDTTVFTVREQDMLDWAEACGETDERFTDPSNPDFQAHPGFTSALVARRHLPDDFPDIGNGRGIDGGKTVQVLQPIRINDVLTATSKIADIYDKTGRSGTMVFIIHRMTYSNQGGQPVAVVDWRMIRSMGA